jgi:hypothetical protein
VTESTVEKSYGIADDVTNVWIFTQNAVEIVGRPECGMLAPIT